MPVLSEPVSHGITVIPDSTVRYVFLGAFLLVVIGIRISRRTTNAESLSSHSEKEPITSKPNIDVTSTEPQSASPLPDAKPRILGPPQPPLFTPPMRAKTDPSLSSFEQMELVVERSPRTRSYTKTMLDGTEVSGEIIVADGWRRHTRVFGGGVCKACEESERRMST